MSYRWHMETISEYILVSAWPDDIKSVVDAEIKNKYQPFGSPFVLPKVGATVTDCASGLICQAMVKNGGT